jgi:hypothetical protein
MARVPLQRVTVPVAGPVPVAGRAVEPVQALLRLLPKQRRQRRQRLSRRFCWYGVRRRVSA